MSSEDIFEIDSWKQFNEIRYDNHKPVCVLTSDIELRDKVIQTIQEFNAVLDGNGHSIRNFRYKGRSPLIIKHNYGTIKNLNIEDFKVQGKKDIGGVSMGGICEYNHGDIRNCYVSGSFESEGSLGGIASRNKGNIKNCTFKGTVETKDMMGGIVRYNKKEGIIEGCHSSGNIKGGQAIGGIAGQNGGMIRNCSSDAVVSNKKGISGCLGGLVGRNYEILKSSYFNGQIIREGEFEDEEGLLVGVNSKVVRNTHCIKNIDGCSFTGDISDGMTENVSLKNSVEKAERSILVNSI